MKKFIAVLLSLAILAGVFVMPSSAAVSEGDEDITEYPVIIVPGFTGSTLCEGGDEDNQVWYFNYDEIIDLVLDRIVELGVGLGALTLGNAEIIAKTLGREMSGVFEKLRCNPDGSSVYDISTSIFDPAVTNKTYLEEYYDGAHQHEPETANSIKDYISEDNIFSFQVDFRMGAEYCATKLDEYVTAVKEYTNKDKVNIFGVSHGGQVTATYLNLFGYKNDVKNAVMTVPAIGGAGIAYDLMNQSVSLDEEGLMRYIERGMMWEDDYNWLLKAVNLGFIDDIFNALIPHIFESLGYWGSLWDFIPAEKYEEVKVKLLDSEKSAELIAKSDRFHYEILPSMNEKLQALVDGGMNISIIAGTGCKVVSGWNEHSDYIITTKSSTGAAVTPFGKRFADGYIQKNPCGGKNKISPDFTIDASTAYLPDNTWFVDGLGHGMTYKDDYTRTLFETLLLTDRIEDVYSNPDYPQFMYSTNPAETVYLRFKDCANGELKNGTNSLIIKNCCKTNTVGISAVVCGGAELDFRVDPSKKIAPGESIELEFEGEIPASSEKMCTVTVYYTSDGKIPMSYRTQNFTVKNGEKAEYPDGVTDAFEDTPFEENTPDFIEEILVKSGLYDFFAMFFNIIYYWISVIFA